MSVRFVNNSAISNTDVVAKTFPVTNPPTVQPWVRNPSWPPCEANSGDNRVRGLYAVFPNGGNFIAINVSSAYTINFGDGTTTNFSSGTQANYEYTYSAAALVGTEAPVTFTDVGDLVTRTNHGYTNNMQVQFYNITTTTGIINGQTYYVINATSNTFQVAATAGGPALPLTNDGTGQLLPYRIATVTITPQAGNNLTSLNFSVLHNQSGLVSGNTVGWLDLAFASPTITTLTMGTTGATIVRLNYLERVRLNQLGSISSFSSLFGGLFKLQNVVIDNAITPSNVSNMFSSCRSLPEAPIFNTSSVTTMEYMFQNCSNLVTVPLYNTASVNTMLGMFQNCTALITVPLFNTAAVTNMSSMFSSASNLQEVPAFNTPLVSNMSSMFSFCFAIKTVTFITPSATTLASMFQNCSSLQTVNLPNTTLVNNTSNMFASCTSLETAPFFNTASVTNMSGMFSSCTTLQTVPLYNTNSLTLMNNMFANCSSLQVIPFFNTANVTTFNSMFNNCFALNSVPALVTTTVPNSTGFTSMFVNCSSLTRIEARNFRFTFSVQSCKLSATALNEIYTNLPTVTGQTITVTGNYGTATDTPSIATAKGWSVTG